MPTLDETKVVIGFLLLFGVCRLLSKLVEIWFFVSIIDSSITQIFTKNPYKTLTLLLLIRHDLLEKQAVSLYSAFFTMHLFLKKQMAYLRIG